jgi:hypothetical protein
MQHHPFAAIISRTHPMADHVTDLIKMTPTAVVTVTSVAGFRWDTASYVLATIWTALMIGDFIWRKWIKPFLHRPDDTDNAGA